MKSILFLTLLNFCVCTKVCFNGADEDETHTHQGHPFSIDQPRLKRQADSFEIISSERRYKMAWEKRWLYKDMKMTKLMLYPGVYNLSERVWLWPVDSYKLNLVMPHILSKYSQCEIAGLGPMPGYDECVNFTAGFYPSGFDFQHQICCRYPSVNIVCLDFTNFPIGKANFSYDDWVLSVHPNDPIIYWKNNDFCESSGNEERILDSYADLPIIEGERTKHIHEVATHPWSVKRARSKRATCFLVCFGTGDVTDEDDVKEIIATEIAAFNNEVDLNRQYVKEAKFEIIKTQQWVQKFAGASNENFLKVSRRMDLIDGTIRMTNAELNRVAAILVRDTIAIKLMAKHLENERGFIMNISLDGVAHQLPDGCWEVANLAENFTSGTGNNLTIFTERPPAINTDIKKAKTVLGMTHLGFGGTTAGIIVLFAIITVIVCVYYRYNKKKKNSIMRNLGSPSLSGKNDNIYETIRY